MRFVETLKPLVALALPAAVVAALSGCASMPDPMAPAVTQNGLPQISREIDPAFVRAAA